MPICSHSSKPDRGFALADKLDEIGPLIRDFLDLKVARQPVKEGT